MSCNTAVARVAPLGNSMPVTCGNVGKATRICFFFCRISLPFTITKTCNLLEPVLQLLVSMLSAFAAAMEGCEDVLPLEQEGEVSSEPRYVSRFRSTAVSKHQGLKSFCEHLSSCKNAISFHFLDFEHWQNSPVHLQVQMANNFMASCLNANNGFVNLLLCGFDTQEMPVLLVVRF